MYSNSKSKAISKVDDLSVKLALPSKGALAGPSLDFLKACGLAVYRPNDRQYIASIPTLPEIIVLFQRAVDIYDKVADGSVDFGITGYDVVKEKGAEYDDVIFLWEELGYGKCKLVLAVPENWIDVSSIEDIAELSVQFRKKGHDLKIATTYANSTRNWLYQKGIIHFSIVEASGALEAAPSIGHSDIIADITSTGTTLTENRLKQVAGGTIMTSTACLIGNTKALLQDERKLQIARQILEMIEAYLRAKKYVSITANVQSTSEEVLAQNLINRYELSSLRGPSITRVYTKSSSENDWFAVTVLVERAILPETVSYLRKAGGTDIVVQTLDYLFDSHSWNFQSFLEKLKNVQRSH